MGVKLILISSIVGVLGMIALTQATPVEVVYMGDSCDCPKSLNYLVNIPPPPKPKEYPTSEYGYKLEVPMQAKAKVTYSFDFIVQEPKIPPPAPEDKLNLYAKVDRITAHKKDCIAPYGKPSRTCGCNRCIATRNYDNRYVSPENRATRNVRKFQHPNSISKNMPASTSKVLAIFMQPLDQPKSIVTKSRNKRDISKIFMRPRKTNSVKRPERMVKQYNKSLQSRTNSMQMFGLFPKPEKPQIKETPKPQTPKPQTPFENLRNFLIPPRLRNKRDIKGEYDLIEKEREQLDLTLPEIIQYMPETLDPNFKRGQCQFNQCRLGQQPEQQEQMAEEDYTDKEITKETLENVNGDETSDDNDDAAKESDNAISSSSHTKRDAANYECGLKFDAHNPHLPNPTPNPGYSFELYNQPPPHSPNYDDLPRPFSGYDPAPQQFVGPSYGYAAAAAPPPPPSIISPPLVGSTYNPYGHHHQASNAQLDQIIADIVNRHSDFIEASTHQGGALVDPSKEQEYQTKSLLKTLIDGHLKKLFVEEPIDNPYSYAPNYRAAGPEPVAPPPPPPY